MDVDFAFIGWFRLRISLHAGKGPNAPAVPLVARYRRGAGGAVPGSRTASGGTGTAEPPDDTAGRPAEYVSRWIAAPVPAAELLDEALLFRVSLEEEVRAMERRLDRARYGV